MAQLDKNSFAPFLGKIDGATVYMRNGKPVMRKSKNSKPNPTKSASQSAARMKWNNVQRLWSEFPKDWQPIYQNRKAGSTNYNAFMSENMHTTPIYFTRKEKENYASVLVPLQITQGILPEIQTSLDEQGLTSKISTGDFEVTTETTLGQFAHAVIANNRNFANGDVITFVQGYQHFDGQEQTPRAIFKCNALELDITSSTPLLQAIGGRDGFEIRNGHVASFVTTGAATWVHSRVNDNQTLVSSQRLWCDNAETIAQYTSPEALARAQRSYGAIKQ